MHTRCTHYPEVVLCVHLEVELYMDYQFVPLQSTVIRAGKMIGPSRPCCLSIRRWSGYVRVRMNTTTPMARTMKGTIGYVRVRNETTPMDGTWNIGIGMSVGSIIGTLARVEARRTLRVQTVRRRRHPWKNINAHMTYVGGCFLVQLIKMNNRTVQFGRTNRRCGLPGRRSWS